MKRVRTEPHGYGAEGDERIRTAVCEPGADPVYERPEDFASLERRASKPADGLLDGFLLELGRFDTETLVAIADYRDAIRPDGWLQRCIREYVEVWR